ARFAKVNLAPDVTRLSDGDKQALIKLVQAARLIDDLFLQQYWSKNRETLASLRQDKSALGKSRLEYFLLNKGPWSALDEHAAFLPDVPPKKLPGANFYPEDLTKPAFESWTATLSPEKKREAESFFTVIRRMNGKLEPVPFSTEYRGELTKLSDLLKQAARLTSNDTLRRFLDARAAAFLSNDYYDSDIAWMDLDAPIDVTIGPYETYNDELFGYKASFEAYVTIRDDAESKKVAFFSDHLQEIENVLPIDAKYRNPKIGALAPIRVVNEVISAGDAAHGIRTAAFNLPNDERVIRAKGSKRVMLKNVQEAKFNSILKPIAARVLSTSAQADLSFDWFFTHILAHELTHGIGPHTVLQNGAESSPRLQLKELYSAIEEAKADVCGLFMLGYMLDKKMLPNAGPDATTKLYTTFLASAFRTLRFGVNEAHGRGMALQLNYLLDKGAFALNKDGTYQAVPDRIGSGVRELAHDLLTIEATGDYAGAKAMLDKLAVVRPAMKATLDKLKDLPTDINPSHVTARALVP
ncbi:MAG: hypothetical protein H7039_00200, partial [Bryobacteraceae bacterium]|nr:hypothetical protein [Bryobacteraceae bacterium]